MPITATTASANARRDRTPSGIGALPWQYRVFARHVLFDPSLDCALPTPAASSRRACLPFATEDGNLCAPPSLSAAIGTEQMTTKFRGVMQSPVTPFKDDFSLDLPTFERLLDFHVRTGATAISWPHHKGESLNLTIAERKLFAEAAVRVVNGRIPVTIHVSALAVEDTMELARHAQDIGADGILAITPYFWTPSLEAIHAYFVRLCRSIELPVLSYNSPSYLAGVEITGDLMSRLIEQLPNFVGVKEASFNSEKFLEISRAALAMRPDFRAC